jgi:peroxiredoxin
MTISVGDRAPDADLFVPGESGPEKVRSTDLFAGRKVVLVGMPGAFTGTCSNSHLPGLIENRDAILAKGVDAILILTTNDTFALNAWAEASGAKGKVSFVSDGNAEFVQKVGLSNDSSARGMGIRAKRFAMILEDGVVTALLLEEQPGQVVTSSAARILEAL